MFRYADQENEEKSDEGEGGGFGFLRERGTSESKVPPPGSFTESQLKVRVLGLDVLSAARVCPDDCLLPTPLLGPTATLERNERDARNALQTESGESRATSKIRSITRSPGAGTDEGPSRPVATSPADPPQS